MLGGFHLKLNTIQMILFFFGLALLIIGYLTYGRFIEKIIAPDDRDTPAVSKFDGVDYVCLPHWKNMLIQLLNIAGVGPVIGVILGVKFGSIVFIIIPIGNLIAGATHDFLSGMMSMRRDGANLPSLIKENLGNGYYKFFSVFMIFLLMLVVAVFINIPAVLIDKSFPTVGIFWASAVGIFAYYVLATLFPIDKIIGKIYPFFGAMLLIGSLAMLCSIMWNLLDNPSLLDESAAFESMKWTAENGHPIIPLLFVTIACGIISGFHATQSPIIARTLKSERQAKSSFYGMMVLEGLIAMIWAAAGLAVYNLFPDYFNVNPNDVLLLITKHFLGSWMGLITVVAVIILAITSGDTAMRSMRLSLAEMFSIDQKSVSKRILTCVPLILAVVGLLAWSQASEKSFGQLWNYFAWGNQVLAASTLMAATVWLFKQKKNGYVSLIPGIFMTFIVISYIVWISPEHGGPVGFGADLEASYIVAGIATLVLGGWVYKRAIKKKR